MTSLESVAASERVCSDARRPAGKPIPRVTVREALVVLAVMVLLAMGWFWRAWASPTTVQVGHPIDQDLFFWFLGWMPYALGHGLNPLVTHAINYPDGVNLMWNTSMPLAALLLSPITVTAGSVVSYNVLSTLGPALSGWCAYLAFRRYGRPLPALAGSLLFAFGAYMAGQADSHPDFTFLASAPLLLILFDRLLVRQDAPAWRLGIWIGLVAAAQLLLAEEILAIEALAVLVAIMVLAIMSPREVRERCAYVARGLGVAAGLFLLIGSWPLAVQFLGPNRVTGPIHPHNVYVSDLASFAVPGSVLHFSPRSAVELSNRFTGNIGESAGAYVGIPLLVLLAVTVGLVRRRLTLVVFVIGAVLALLSLGPKLHVGGQTTSVRLPWSLFGDLPIARNLLPARLTFAMSLMVGLLLVLYLGRARSLRSWHRTAAWALAIVGLAALLPRSPYYTSRTDSVVAFRDRTVCSMTGERHPSILVLPMSDHAAMRWQEQANFCFDMPGGALASGPTCGPTEPCLSDTYQATDRTPIASYGPAPFPLLGQVGLDAEYGQTLPPVTPAVRQAVERELAQPRVSEVAVGPMNNQSRLTTWLQSVLGAPSAIVGRTYIWTSQAKR